MRVAFICGEQRANLERLIFCLFERLSGIIVCGHGHVKRWVRMTKLLAARLGVLGVFVALAACESMPQPDPMARLMPGEVRSGLAEAAIQSVERDIPESEVLAAIEGMIGAVPVCMAAPGLWLSGAERSGQFSVRYDLMARDWGRDSAAQARARMDEFVDLGFLSETVTEQGAVSYAVTEAGRPLLRGAFGAGSPPSFCAPAERRVVEIVEMEWGAFDCGSLRVQFSHTNDDWPSWATTAFAQQAVAQSFPAPGEIAYGGVSLSRYWVSRPAAGQPNGALRSMCYDAARQRLANGDLTLDRQGAAVEIVEDAAVDAVDAAAVEAVSVEAVGAAEVEAAEAEQAVTN